MNSNRVCSASGWLDHSFSSVCVCTPLKPIPWVTKENQPIHPPPHQPSLTIIIVSGLALLSWIHFCLQCSCVTRSTLQVHNCPLEMGRRPAVAHSSSNLYPDPDQSSLHSSVSPCPTQPAQCALVAHCVWPYLLQRSATWLTTP